MILYFGNVLSSKGNNPSFIELLAPKLAEFDKVIVTSSVRFQIFRLLDMILTFFRFRHNSNLILIDTYSYRGFYYAFVIGFLSALFNKPYFPIIRGGDFRARLVRTPRLAHYFLRKAAKVIVPSEFLYHLLREKGVEPVIIPNFLELEAYRFLRRNNYKPRVLWVRSFHRIYQPEFAIKILANLINVYGKANLCMVGPDKDGSMKACKVLARELGIDQDVEFTGYLAKKEWHERSVNYDIFLNTTSIDNQPVSVLEAMALGLVVVSSNVGGIPFLIKHEENGLLTPAYDMDGFVERISRLLNDSGFAQLLQTNARSMAEKYDWSVIRTLWSELLSPYLK